MGMTEAEVRLKPENVAANVWTNSRFLRLWIGSALTNMAFSIYLLTETWYVVQKLNQETWLGIVLMMTTIPRILLMVVGGVFADRLRRSHLLFLLNISRAIMLAAMIGLLLTQSLTLDVLFVCALVFGVLDAFFWPADRSILPTVVHKQQLVKANSIMETTNQLFFFIGPCLGWVSSQIHFI
jgi:DHA3 family macrolide efflux protein-like MFS transporter